MVVFATVSLVSSFDISWLNRKLFSLISSTIVLTVTTSPGRAQEMGREPDRVEELPGGLVKFAHVPHDIHVAHVIAMPWVDGASISNQSCRHDGSLDMSDI